MSEVFSAVLVIGCGLVAYTDARYGMVYNRVTLPLASLALAAAAQEGRAVPALVGAAVAGGIMLAAVLAGGAGGGDFKLALALGLCFGWPRVGAVMLGACVLGAVWGLARLAVAGRLGQWCRGFAASLWLVVVCGIWVCPEVEDCAARPVPLGRVAFGACLAAAALAALPGPKFLWVALAAAAAAVCWLVDRRWGYWAPRAAGGVDSCGFPVLDR